MSREIILEAMNGIRDEYITEVGAKLGLVAVGAAGAVGAAVEPSALYSLSGTEAAAKAGFGAWVAKGGWIALVAGVVVAAGVAAGAFFFGKGGDVPPVGTGDMTTAEQEQSRFEGDDSEEPTEEPTENTTEDTTEDMTEKETEGDTDRDPQDDSSNDTDESFRITSFAPEDTFSPLLIPDPGKFTINEDGSLTIIGKPCSTLYFPAMELMKLSPGYDEAKAFVPHTILIKFTRENCGTNSPSTWVSDNTQGLMPVGVGCQYFAPEGYTYEYVLITVGDNEEFVEGSKPYVQFEWVNESSTISKNRSITIHEISFYSSFTTSMKGMGVLLSEEGMGGNAYEYGATQSGGGVLQGGLDEVQPIITLPSTTPEGAPVVGISQYCFRQNQYLHIVTIPEGILKIEEEAFYHCHNLATVYLPDSLRIINESAFNYCTILTEVHLGSGIQYIGENAFHYSLRDIYYNGTMEDWSRVVIAPSQTGWLGPSTVHCTDGDIPAKQEASVQKPVDTTDLSALLAMAEPIPLQEGQTVSRVEATPLTIYDEERYSPMEVVLRWAIIEDASHLKGLYYYFDILSPEDGRILRAMPLSAASAYPRLQNSAMILIDTDIMGFDPTILFISYSYYEGNSTLNLISRGYSITATEDGGVSFWNWNNNEGSIGITDVEAPLEPRKLKILSTLATKLSERDYPARVLLSTNPVNDRAFYSIADAPVITREYAEALAAITHKQFSESGLDGIYEEYGLCNKP